MKEKIKNIIISILILSLGIYGLYYYITEVKCYTEYRVLTNQYLDNTSYLGGGNCSQSCLFMETLEYSKNPKNAIMNYWYLDNYSKYNITRLYFSNENKLRTDLQNGQEIIITWCPTPYGDRIRGVN